MGMITRILAFIYRWKKHPLFVLFYSINFFRSQFKAGVTFYTDDEFMEQLGHGKSFIRLNDGEFHLMNGGSLAYQPYYPGIEKSFREFVKQYSKDSPYIIGLPKTCMNKTNEDLKKEGKLYVWLPAKTMFRLFFPKNVSYGDGHAFYMDGFFIKIMEPILITKHMIVVTNKQSIENFKNNKAVPFKRVSFVETPSADSYGSYQKIYDDTVKAIDLIKGKVASKKDIALIFSVGPASKQLVYEFSKVGYSGYDIGKGFEALYTDESLESRI